MPDYLPPWSTNTEEYLEGWINYLARTTSRLRTTRVLLFVVTILDLAVGLISLALQYSPVSYIGALALMLGDASLSFVGLILLYYFDSIRRRGQALSQELSDALQNQEFGSLIPMVDRRLRLILREFALDEELPFAPTQMGILIYFAILVFSVTMTITSMSGRIG